MPWVMYFCGTMDHGRVLAQQLRRPASHGCVNLIVEDAQVLYNWASEGTEVWVH